MPKLNIFMKKKYLSVDQIKEIRWLRVFKGRKNFRVGKFQNFWVLSQYKSKGPFLLYDQEEWDAFIAGIKNHEFDDLINIIIN